MKDTAMDTETLRELAARWRNASDRTGKPSGVHMIDGQRMIAKHFRTMANDDEDARNLADVADCMAHCIENEALLFECLRSEALKAADAIEAFLEREQAREAELAAVKAERDRLRDALELVCDETKYVPNSYAATANRIANRALKGTVG